MALEWESLSVAIDDFDAAAPRSVSRAAVPGGWLVSLQVSDDEHQFVFVADPNHEWDGNSVS